MSLGLLLILSCQPEDNLGRDRVAHTLNDCGREPCPGQPACERNAKVLEVVVTKPSSGTAVSCLCPGDDYYVDRYWLPTHTLQCVPQRLHGAVWIKTSNTGDKYNVGEDNLQFTVTVPAEIYVAFDSRLVRDRHLPRWLRRDFTPTPEWVDIDEPDPTQEFEIFHRRAAAGKIVLGGNRVRGLRGEDLSMYLVAIKPQVPSPEGQEIR